MARTKKTRPNGNGAGEKTLQSWIWNAACSIRGARDAPKYKDFILPLIFTKRLCDVFDDELNRIAAEVGSRKKAFQVVKRDPKLVRFYLPLVPDDPEDPVWSVIRRLADRIGEGVTSHMRAIAKTNPGLKGIIDRVDFNATTHGQRDINDNRLSHLIEGISTRRVGLNDVETDIIMSRMLQPGPDELFNDPSWNGYETRPVGNANFAWILRIVSKPPSMACQPSAKKSSHMRRTEPNPRPSTMPFKSLIKSAMCSAHG